MSGMWKRSHGSSIATPPDERGGNSCDGPTATAPRLDSTLLEVAATGRSRMMVHVAHPRKDDGSMTACYY
jgi:hypothetical protein